MPLLMFLLLHQIALVNGASTYSVRIRRVNFSGKQQDSFVLPKSHDSCSSQNECNRYNANLSPNTFERDLCLCSCSRGMAATFGVKNGSWSCIGNKEIRDRELDGKLHLFCASRYLSIQWSLTSFGGSRKIRIPLYLYTSETLENYN